MMINKRIYFFSFLFSLFSFITFAQESGVIIELSGTVELKTSEDAPFVPANVRDMVFDDTVISTGFRSSALIEVGSVLITVRPLTRMTFIEIRTSDGDESLNLNLQVGRVRVDIDPPAGTRTSLDVVSPMAVASVRGTSFEFDTQTLIVNSGQVSFRGSAGQNVGIRAGSIIAPALSGRVWNPVTAGSSGHRPSPPAGMQPNTAPALVAVTFSENPGSTPPPGTDPGTSPPPPPPSDYDPTPTPTPGSGDAGFEFFW